jgi:transposase
MEDWAEIRRLHRGERMRIKAIARRLGVVRNTVRETLRSDMPPRYERQRKGSIVDAVEGDVLAVLREFPTMPATVIAVRWIGGERSITVLRHRVAELRPLFAPPTRASARASAQASWPSSTCGSPTWRSRSGTAKRTSCG